MRRDVPGTCFSNFQKILKPFTAIFLSALFFCVLAVFAALPGTAHADIFYASSNYSTGSAGVITASGGSFTVNKDVVSNFGVDAWGFTFRDAGGAERAMVREYNYGPNDTIYVWNPANWKAPIVNTSSWGSNVHAVATLGQYLYITTYESYKDGSRAQDTGEVVRIDTLNGYKPDKRYQYGAFVGDAGFESSPHGEALHVENGKIYALFGVSYKGVNEYEPTEVVEFDPELNRLRTVRLKDTSGNIGKNAMRMAAYGGKLYVANMGGYQGPDSWGDLWEVDIATMISRRILDGHDIPYTVDGKSVNVGMYGIQFAPDGTAFLLAGSYSGDYVFRTRLFITTADRLSRGDAGSAVVEFIGKRGYSWDILWDEKDSILWCMTGTSLQARTKGGALLREFTPAELGDNIYSVSLLDGDDGSTGGGAWVDETPAFAPPDGIETGSGTRPATRSELETLLPAGSVAEDTDGTVTASKSAFVSGLDSETRESIDTARVTPLPAFHTGVATGRTALVTLGVNLGGYAGETLASISVLKMKPDGSAVKLKPAASRESLTDGSFVWTDAGGSAIPLSEKAASGKSYSISVAVKDGGEYDLDPAGSAIVDPLALAAAKQASGGSGGESGGSGGGGCSAGAFGLSILLGVSYMALKRKKTLSLIVIAALSILSGLFGLGQAGQAEGAQVKLLVTPGAGVRAFSKEGGEYLQTAHFVPFKEYSLSKSGSEGGYDAYSLAANGERFHYVAGGGDSGFLKTAKVVYISANETQKTVTIDAEKLDASKREDNAFKGDGVYFNVNDAQHLVLAPGETFKLIPIRVWQAMEGFTENYFIEPDYKVEVLGGGAVSSKWAGSPGLEYAEVTGLKPGTAVLKVTYGPIRFDYDSGKYEYYNAIEPINTGIVVVTVANGGKNSGITTNIKAREYDTIYFDKALSDHAEYAFKPSGTGGLSVRSHRPIHDGTSWGSGWGDGVKNSDGSFTVNLYEGRNIVEVSSASTNFSEYHVINAKGLDISVKNVTNLSWKEGDALKAGDSLEISFGGIKTPLEKISGIYNPGFPDTCYVKYESPQGEIRGEGVQYNLSEINKITVTVPSSGKVELTGGIINCDHMGDPLGNHRTRPGHEPVYPNFTAINVKGAYCAMPGITLPRQSGGGTPAQVEETPAFAPPPGIEAGSGTRPATPSEMEKLLPKDSVTANADGTATASTGAFVSGLDSETRELIDTARMTPLPAFHTGVATGETALVTLRVRLDSYAGETLGSISVLKMKSDGSAEKLNPAASREGLADGSFVWTDESGNAIPPSDKAEAGRGYCLSVAVKDNGEGGYDLDPAQGAIVDPLALAAAKQASSGSDASNGSGGGGCVTGAFAFAGMAAVLAVSMKKFKARKKWRGFKNV